MSPAIRFMNEHTPSPSSALNVHKSLCGATRKCSNSIFTPRHRINMLGLDPVVKKKNRKQNYGFLTWFSCAVRVAFRWERMERVREGERVICFERPFQVAISSVLIDNSP